MPFFDPIRIGSSGSVDIYTIDRSLRFSGADQTRLNYTPASGGNKKTWTLSWWLKRGLIDRRMLFGSYNSGATTAVIELQDDHNLNFYDYDSGYRINLETTQVFRDPSAWYHFVIALDTTQSTDSNRVKIYVNGSQITDFANATYPSQNFDGLFNDHTIQHAIGTEGALQRLHLDGYMADVYFLDGYAYDPSYFGETDATTGQWIPKEYTGSFGNNGYYLKFDDNSGTTATTLGKDSSGNGNNVTPVNFSVSAGYGNDSVEDTPTNNWCTLNTIFRISGRTPPNYSNAALEINNTGGGDMNTHGTFGVKSGKYYFEGKSENADGVYGTHFIGVQESSPGHVNQGVYRSDGRVYDGSASPTQSGTTYDGTQTIGVAFDADTGKVWFAKNNTWISSGDPANGNNAAFTYSTTDHLQPAFAFDNTSDGKKWYVNFGQQPFAYTPPTGFVALNSSNLPNPTILLPNEHFNTVTYTGNGGTIDQNFGFNVDWVWYKNRGRNNTDHYSFDTVRGANKAIYQNSDGTENSVAPTFYTQSFITNGSRIVRSNGDHLNESGDTYVSWGWNAGNTDGKTYTVTVVDSGGNKFRFDGFATNAVTLDLAEGGTYIFNYPSGHPFRFSTTSDGTHGGGSEYTTGVTHNSSTQVTIVVAASAPQLHYYCSSHSGMGGAINTNSSLGSSNFEGNTQATVKANPTAGFSIISWNARGTSSGTYDTFGHGLGVRPNWLILKSRNATGNWNVYNSNFDSANNKILQLSNLIIETTSSNYWGADNTTPSSTLVNVNQGNYANSASPSKFIMYAFSSVEGFSKFGTYVGNSNADGVTVYTGFAVSWLMIKRASGGTDPWLIHDSVRDPDNVIQDNIFANSQDSEFDTDSVDFLSNGFKLRINSGLRNNNGDTFVYFAFAESPFKNSRAR